MAKTFPCTTSSLWLHQQIKLIERQLDHLLDQIVFEQEHEAAATAVMRARLHLLHACHHCGLPPLPAPITTKATPIPAQEIH
jgi:hypothetical protein